MLHRVTDMKRNSRTYLRMVEWSFTGFGILYHKEI